MAENVKTFDTRALASLTDGRLLVPNDEGGFSRVHHVAEWLLGAPVWTHHFGDAGMMELLKALALAQFPDLPKEGEFSDYRDAARHAVDRYGPRVDVAKGDGTGAMSPVDGLHPLLRKGARDHG